MKKRIFLNGACGRIGRAVAYEISQQEDLELCALNDPVGIDAIFRNYVRRDSTHGKLDWHIEKLGENTLAINGKKVRVLAEKDTKAMQLKDLGIHIVEECSGIYAKDEKARAFMINGVERVIMSYPVTGGEGHIMLVAGVNHELFDPSMHILISNASCTTKALAAPLAILLDHGFNIEALLMDTVHAATNSQHLLDFSDDYAALNQISTHKTGAAIATGEVLPLLKGKMDGLAFRVPTTDGSFANLYFVANYPEELTAKILNEILRKNYQNAKYLGRVALHEEKEAASTDIIGRTENAIIITSKTRVFPLPYTLEGKRTYLVGLVSGYDNELGPPKDQVILTKYIADKSDEKNG